MTCVFCRDGHMVVDGQHYRISEKGISLLGACTWKPEDPEDRRPPQRVDRALERIREKARAARERVDAANAARVLTTAKHYTEREVGEEG